MSRSSRSRTQGAAENSPPRPNGRRIRQRSGSLSAEGLPPFSPFGRHSGVRRELLEVGNALARDEGDLLSGVSVNALRRALSTFLGEVRIQEGASRSGLFVGSTSKQGASSGRTPRSSRTEAEIMKSRADRLAKRDRDRKLVSDLRMKQKEVTDGYQDS